MPRLSCTVRISADNLSEGKYDLQVFTSELLWRQDFKCRGVGTAEVLQVDGDECIALVVQGALVLETVLNVVEGGVAVAAYHALVADACYSDERQHDGECLAQPHSLLNGTEQLTYVLILSASLEVLKENVGVKEYFHDSVLSYGYS